MIQNFRTGIADLKTLTSNQIGAIGENFAENVLLSGKTRIKTTTITVKIAGRDEPFTLIPDFLVLEDVNDQGVALLRYVESKASRNGLPGVGQLTDNQAVFLDALRNGEVESISGSSAFDAFLGANGAESAEIVGFQMYATQLFS